ncbi:MAG: tetratricopeptide repeat protein [Bacteroidota bacterium]|nr:tetratricopeptide repeat protein [Bacteroidota bacterium]MDP3144443.1 tetratricopeptide repeat protein [Bacteroidota bacterium]
MTFNNTKNSFICFSLLFIFTMALNGCKNNSLEQTDTEIKTSDSLSIKLNSPELKAINLKLLNDPNNAELYNTRASIYISLKQLPEAINDSKRCIKLDSTKSEYYMTLVDAYYSQNNTRSAKDLLEIIEKKFPENTEALLKLSELFYLVKQYQKGIDYVNKALKINDRLAKAYYLKGSIYRESGDTARAISSLQTAIEQDNKYENAFIDMGLMYAARKNPIALEYYNNALKVNPYNENTIYARAKLLQDIGKTDEAITEYNSILQKNKSCENCYYNLGAIYLEIKKDNKTALENFTNAIMLNPNFAQAYFARGYTYAKLKDKESAKADYNMCLKIQPNFEAAIQALNEL